MAGMNFIRAGNAGGSGSSRESTRRPLLFADVGNRAVAYNFLTKDEELRRRTFRWRVVSLSR
jgi:hypothetical protein